MLPTFSVKSSQAAAKESAKRPFESFQENSTVLATSDMLEVKGGRHLQQVPVRAFTAVFSWNTSCGGPVPQ